MGNTTLYLECVLSAEEIQDRLQRLKTAELSRGAAEDRLHLADDAWKREKKTLESEVSAASANCRELAQVLKTGREMRNVDCLTEIRPPHHLTIRLDTGEVVRTRAATGEELQMILPGCESGVCSCPKPLDNLSPACPQHGLASSDAQAAAADVDADVDDEADSADVELDEKFPKAEAGL